MAVCSVRSRLRERFGQRHRAGQRNAVRRPDLTADEDELALVRVDVDAHLRVVEEARGEPRFEPLRELVDRQAARDDLADQRKRDESVGVDAVDAGQIRLVEDRDSQLVLRAERVVGGRLRRIRLRLRGRRGRRRILRRRCLRRLGLRVNVSATRSVAMTVMSSLPCYSVTRASGIPS